MFAEFNRTKVTLIDRYIDTYRNIYSKNCNLAIPDYTFIYILAVLFDKNTYLFIKLILSEQTYKLLLYTYI